MRIGINAQLLSNSLTYRNAGISMYIRHLLAHLPAAAEEHEFLIYSGGTPGDVIKGGGNWLHVPTRWPTGSPYGRILWEQLVLPLHLKLSGIDVLHSTMHVLPAVCPARSVVTVLDLTFMRYPETFPCLQRRYLEAATRRAVGKADAVITISESTKRDVMSLLGVSEDRIFTTPLAADACYRPVSEEDRDRVAKKYGLGPEFILYLGTLEPRKNIPMLLAAYRRIRRDVGERRLVLAGGKGWFYDRIFALVEELGLGDSVIFPGYIAGEDLPALYCAAAMFIYPSLYEGFGLPPLEAMSCGTPVITSNVSSLPEVVGDAGIMVDPDDPEELADVVLRVLRDSELRQKMRLKSLEQAKRFSWKETAERTLNVYKSISAG